MISAIHQHESAIGTAHQLWVSFVLQKIPVAIYCTYGNRYVSMLLSQIISPSFALIVYKSLFSMSISQFLPCK